MGLENFLKAKAEIGETPDQVPLEIVMDLLSENLFRKYISYTTCMELWNALLADYETIELYYETITRKKSRNEKLSDYIDKLTALS